MMQSVCQNTSILERFLLILSNYISTSLSVFILKNTITRRQREILLVLFPVHTYDDACEDLHQSVAGSTHQTSLVVLFQLHSQSVIQLQSSHFRQT